MSIKKYNSKVAIDSNRNNHVINSPQNTSHTLISEKLKGALSHLNLFTIDHSHGEVAAENLSSRSAGEYLVYGSGSERDEKEREEIRNNPDTATLKNVSAEIQTMEFDERKTMLATIKHHKEMQRYEIHRQQKLRKKINEIITSRPPFSNIDPKNCYICFKHFWPVIYPMIRCDHCMIVVCKHCIKEYKIGKICSQCALELLYQTQIGTLWSKYKTSDFSDHLDVSVIEKLIITASVDEMHKANSSDHIDSVSTKQKSGTSKPGNIFRQMLFSKKRDKSLDSSKSSSPKHSPSNGSDDKSMMSMAISNELSEAVDNQNSSKVSGEILVSLHYHYNKHEFKVVIKKCRDLLAAVKNGNSSNPFVKIGLLPKIVNEPVLRTSIRYSTCTPEYNEQCKFKNIMFDELMARTLTIEVIHRQWIGRDVFLGQALIELVKYCFDDPSPTWHKLEERHNPVIEHPVRGKYHGDISFSLKYTENHYYIEEGNHGSMPIQEYGQESSSSGNLVVWIIQANNLFTSSFTSLPNSYAKCTLMSDRSKNIKKKTKVNRNCYSPIWNVKFVFPNIDREELDKTGLEITVWDKNIGFIPDIFLGGISMNRSRGNKPINSIETEVWQKMIEKSETWIEAKLILRSDIR